MERSDSSSNLTDNAAEKPNCAVCLEKVEDEGLLTILCNHTFHAECLIKLEK